MSCKSLFMQNKDLWCEFFRAFRDLPELWTIRRTNYREKIAKQKALNKLLEVYRKLDPNADVRVVQKRINTIRSCYRRELKKVMKSRDESETLDNVYVPTLWYYDKVTFLAKGYRPLVERDSETDKMYDPLATAKKSKMEIELSTNLSARDSAAIMESEYYDDSDKESVSLSEPETPPFPSKRITKSAKVVDSESETDFDSSTEVQETPERERRPVRVRKATKRSFPTTPRCIDDTTPEDDVAIFAASWATSYRKLTGMQEIFAKKAIEDILVLGKLEQLNFKTVNKS